MPVEELPSTFLRSQRIFGLHLNHLLGPGPYSRAQPLRSSICFPMTPSTRSSGLIYSTLILPRHCANSASTDDAHAGNIDTPHRPTDSILHTFLANYQHQGLYVNTISNASAQTPLGLSASLSDVKHPPTSRTLHLLAERLCRVRCARWRAARPPPPYHRLRWKDPGLLAGRFVS
ncbi:uncharacterized protein SCHCODRAFT_02629970 [Schizophyllum commune H4-8]|uniref:uncharacterized protein n=1 Tax=Schizophyllum commune (strain H4-8 / FGSC 9210) TaxID=578458 RepID=UPI002160D00E|nr:uncharacterized protein SCHCODRAFT_02629970 [Schizophyllum commune H4-8]KAI5891753.1 hypothetical protein SCHCODRAFT_02629970 [Schizophyllum commune H4-8]